MTSGALDHPDLPDAPPRRRELARLLVGALLSFVVTAYGAGAAAAVLLSDAETVGAKVDAAVAAVPTLVDEWRDAQYVVDNRAEIRAAVDYLEQNAPTREELESQASRSADTLRRVEETYGDVAEAGSAFTRFPPRPDLAFSAVRDALDGRPDLSSIRDLSATAEQLAPVIDQVEVLVPVYYGSLAAVNDNLAEDELASTLLVAAAALATASVLAHAVGFWARRGRPSLVGRTLQRAGARVWRRWWGDHLPYALGGSVHAVARERFRRDLLADPASVLGADDLRLLAARLAPPNDQKSS